MNKTILVFFTLLFILSIVSTSYSQTIQDKYMEPPLKTDIIKVKGVGCSGELTTIANTVKKMDGVSYCKIIKGGATSKFEVSYDSNNISIDEINIAIENISGCDNPNEKPYSIKK